MELKKLLEEVHYDIIHIQINRLLNGIPIFIPYFYARKAIIIGHSHTTRLPESTPLFGKLLHQKNTVLLRKLCIEKWACSSLAGKWLWGETFNNDNIIPNAIDAKHFAFNEATREVYRKRCGFCDENKVIGFVGRFTEEKNILFLPDILMQLKKISPSYKFLIVGNGRLENALRDGFKKLHLDSSVCFVGEVQDAAPWYSAMDALVLPSFFEGLPVVGIEAQANGLPCFVSNTITKELDITKTVHYLPVNNASEIWANAIHKTLKKRNLGNICFPKEYDIEFSIKQLEERYLKLIKSHN